MPHEFHHHDATSAGVSPDSIRHGHEPLSTKTSALGLTLLVFFLVASLMLWGVWGLMGHYLVENKPEDAPASAAPAIARVPTPPLEPMPLHNDADWQDLVHLRNRENEQFSRMGWQVNERTGEAMIPAAIADAIEKRYGESAVAKTPAPLDFPPPMAPAPAGPRESLNWAELFPPTGEAAIAYHENSVVLRGPPGRGISTNPTTRKGS